MEPGSTCPRCNTPVRAEYRFCPRCGLDLECWPLWVESKGCPYHPPTLREMAGEALLSPLRPRPLNAPPSKAVYTNRQGGSLVGYWTWGLFLLLGGLVVSYGWEWYTYLGFTIAGFVVPLAILLYIYRSDRYEREPLALVVYLVGWGAFAGVLAGMVNNFFTLPFLGPWGAALVEEPLKVAGVYLMVQRTDLREEFNNHLDGMIYGAAVAAGFAGLENFWYIYEMVSSGVAPPFLAIVLRSLSGAMHVAWTSMAARSLGLAKALKGYVEPNDILPGLILPIALHALWNIAPTPFSLLVVLPFTLGSFNRLLRLAERDEVAWGYAWNAPKEEA